MLQLAEELGPNPSAAGRQRADKNRRSERSLFDDKPGTGRSKWPRVAQYDYKPSTELKPDAVFSMTKLKSRQETGGTGTVRMPRARFHTEERQDNFFVSWPRTAQQAKTRTAQQVTTRTVHQANTRTGGNSMLQVKDPRRRVSQQQANSY